MNFVDEQNVMRLQVGQQRRQIARPHDNGAGSRAESDAKFLRDNLRQRGFPEARRPEQQST